MLYESIKRRSGKSGRERRGDLYLSIVYERFVCGAVFAKEFPPRVIKPGCWLDFLLYILLNHADPKARTMRIGLSCVAVL